MDIKDKTVVVTGGASGIGRALAINAADRGAKVVVADLHRGEETVETIRSAGGTADTFLCDIADPQSVTALAQWAQQRFGGVHVLAANAGTGTAGRLEECTLEDFARVMQVNLFGTFHCVQAFAPLLRQAAASGAGAALMITGSEHSLAIPPNQETAAYTISKHALLGMADPTTSSVDRS